MDSAREQHLEVFQARSHGPKVTIPCGCGIGRDHSYLEWVERYQPPTDRGRADPETEHETEEQALERRVAVLEEAIRRIITTGRPQAS